MIEIGIALKSRADVEVAYELCAHNATIRAVDYSPLLRLFVRQEYKPAIVALLTNRSIPADDTPEKKSAANYFLAKLGSRPAYKLPSIGATRPYASQILEVRLPTVSAFEVGEIVREATPHTDIVRVDILWLLRFPLDVVRIAVDAIQNFINRADTPTAVQSAEDLLSDIELKLIRLGG